MKKNILLFFLLVLASFCKSQTIDNLLKEASALIDKKDYKAAMVVYDKAWKKDSLNYNVYLNRGILYTILEEREKAFYDFSKAITIQPDSSEGYMQRSIVLSSMLYTDEAIYDISKALDLATNDMERLVCLGNRGNMRQQKRDFQGAYEDYYKAFLLDTTNLYTINNMATSMDELGRRDEAIAYLKKVIKIDSVAIGGYINLGFQYTKMGLYQEAVDYFDKALQIDKDEPLALNNRGLAKYHLLNYSGAMEDINSSLKFYPGNSYAFKNRALVFIALKQNDNACKDLRRAVELGFTEVYGPEAEELIKLNCIAK